MFIFLLKNIYYFLRKSVFKNAINKFIFINTYKKKINKNINSFIFFKFFIISEIIKKKYNHQNSKKSNTDLNNYVFSEDWFSINIPCWNYIINKEFNKNLHLKYLEIGSFEGRSAIYICETFKNFEVTCVDPFDVYESVESSAKKQSMKSVYKTFLSNISYFKDRIQHFKVYSNKFFSDNKDFFDIIYIDGSHFYLDVLNDFKNSLKFLNKGGIIIFDDFLWNYYEKIEENPVHAIFLILEKENNLKIISASNQLIVKKIL